MPSLMKIEKHQYKKTPIEVTSPKNKNIKIHVHIIYIQTSKEIKNI